MIGLVIAGCGGGSDTASITKAEFIEKASAACARIHGQAKAEFAAFMTSQSQEPAAANPGLAELGRKFVIGPKQQELKEFVALGMPSEGESEAKAIVVSFENGIKKAEGEPAAVAQNSTAAFGGPEELAAKYGLKGC